NIDFEIGAGNEAAIAIRFHAAQHAILAHVNFNLGSALAGIHDAGNIGEDLHFSGGRFGIMTRKPSPAWQYTLVDSSFEGQREAAIRENEAQLTLVNVHFRNVPTAVAIDPRYSDWLWVKNARLENISGPAFIISNENSRLTQINLEDIHCSKVPVFAQFRESGKRLAAPADTYTVKSLSHGLTIPDLGGIGVTRTTFNAAPASSLPQAPPPVIKALPPTGTWTNVRSLGLKGDGKTDDTEALRKAIAAHKVLYLPAGHYVVSDTIEVSSTTTRSASSRLKTARRQTQSAPRSMIVPSYRVIGSPAWLCL
ncbi:gluconolaconase, partial [Anaerolineae bacterium CFX8]|nr:gluconolaconase [Anaerolineae bacterium CFX8]